MKYRHTDLGIGTGERNERRGGKWEGKKRDMERVEGAGKKMGKQFMVFDERNTLVFPNHNKYPCGCVLSTTTNTPYGLWTQSVPPRLKTSDSSSTRNPCWQPLLKLHFGLQFCCDSCSRMEFLYGFLANSYLPCLMEMLRLAKTRSGFR